MCAKENGHRERKRERMRECGRKRERERERDHALTATSKIVIAREENGNLYKSIFIDTNMEIDQQQSDQRKERKRERKELAS